MAPKYLEKPLVVVNMPGAGSTTALNELAKSTPDGHTIGLMTSTYKSMTIHQQKIPFDPKILRPFLGYAELRQVLFTRADSPYAKLSPRRSTRSTRRYEKDFENAKSIEKKKFTTRFLY